jgi:hypothetical protein
MLLNIKEKEARKECKTTHMTTKPTNNRRKKVFDINFIFDFIYPKINPHLPTPATPKMQVPFGRADCKKHSPIIFF